MRIRLTKGNKRFYPSLFISLILCIVITMLIVSTILYVNFESIALEQVYTADMKNLMQTSQGVRIMADTAMTLSNQIYNDLNVAKLLYYSNPEISDIRTASDQLTNYRLSLSFIDSVYVYNGKAGTFYINSSSNGNSNRDTIQPEKDFDDKDCLGILHNFNEYKQYIPIPRRYSDNLQDGTVKYFYTFLLYDAFSASSIESAVIVNISEDWIHNVISNEAGSNSSETFIINGTGQLVSNSDSFPMRENISDREYIKEILKNSNAQGYFIETVDGVKSLISFTAPDKIGWRYIRITPCDAFFGKIDSMRKVTILIGFGILLFGLVFSLLVSRKLYVPIDKILMNLKKLEEERNSDFVLIKQGVLKDIVLGREIENRNGLLGRLKSLDIKVDLDGSFRLILFRIDHYREFYLKYGSEDRNLFRFAIMNIGTELLSRDYRTEAIDMGEGNIVIIINDDRISNATQAIPNGESGEGERNIQDLSQTDKANDMTELLKSIREAIFNCIKVSVTITVSGRENSIEGISLLYRQAMEASLHRLFYGHGAVIFAEKIALLSEKEYVYPVNREKQMIDALMSQKSEDVKRIFDEIVYDTSEHPFSVINLVMSRLVFAVNNTVNIIKSNNPAIADFDRVIPTMLVNNAEVIEEITVQFYSLFDSLCEKLDERKNTKHEELIASIHNIIDREYTNPSLSIESIADKLGISPTYMCRLYKQYTMSTILDKIVEVRMEKARKLLQKTACSIAEIAEETGFTNSSYFYRAFKKYNGTTPNEFRRAGTAGQ